MIFALSKASNWNSDKGKEKYEKLGFTFEKETDPYFVNSGRPWRESDTIPTIELHSLEDLLQFAESLSEELIIGTNSTGQPSLTIYDDYLE